MRRSLLSWSARSLAGTAVGGAGSRVVDTADLRPLWPLTGFVSAEEAIAFKDGCYPDDQPDPYLAAFLRERVVH